MNKKELIEVLIKKKIFQFQDIEKGGKNGY